MDFLLQPVRSFLQAIKQRLRQWTKPDNHALALNVALDFTRSKSKLMIENALLRRQLTVLNRQVNTDVLTYTWDVALGLPQVLATSDGAQYVHGLDLVAEYRDGEWSYPLGDALGSVRQWTDDSGFITYRGDYTPFGVALSSEGSTESAWGYTGEWEDASLGAVYLRARWYQPEVGRFMQRDALRSEPPYAYTANNPVNYIDPRGETPIASEWDLKLLRPCQYEDEWDECVVLQGPEVHWLGWGPNRWEATGVGYAYEVHWQVEDPSKCAVVQWIEGAWYENGTLKRYYLNPTLDNLGAEMGNSAQYDSGEDDWTVERNGNEIVMYDRPGWSTCNTGDVCELWFNAWPRLYDASWDDPELGLLPLSWILGNPTADKGGPAQPPYLSIGCCHSLGLLDCEASLQ